MHSLLSLKCPFKHPGTERLESNYVPSPEGCCGLAIRVHFLLHLLYMTHMGVTEGVSSANIGSMIDLAHLLHYCVPMPEI